MARKIAALKSFFEFLTEEVKAVPENPTKELTSLKAERRLPRPLSEEEAKTLVESPSKRQGVLNRLPVGARIHGLSSRVPSKAGSSLIVRADKYPSASLQAAVRIPASLLQR